MEIKIIDPPNTVPQVIVAIQGGVAYVEQIPPGIEVIIKDYDIEGLDTEEEADRIQTDDEGDYLCRVFK